MSECIAVIQGCEECARRSKCDGDCDDLCESLAEELQSPEGHEAWHQAGKCWKCGTYQDDEDGEWLAVQSRCKYGNCAVASCPKCGTEWYSDGPVTCPCYTGPVGRFVLRFLDFILRPITRRLADKL